MCAETAFDRIKCDALRVMLMSGFLNLTVVASQGPVAQALFLGDQSLFNSTRDDCVWKRGNDRDHCPDDDISMILYTPQKTKLKVNFGALAHTLTNASEFRKTCATNEPFAEFTRISTIAVGEINVCVQFS